VGYFDPIDHAALMDRVRGRVKDKGVLAPLVGMTHVTTGIGSNSTWTDARRRWIAWQSPNPGYNWLSRPGVRCRDLLSVRFPRPLAAPALPISRQWALRCLPSGVFGRDPGVGDLGSSVSVSGDRDRGDVEQFDPVRRASWMRSSRGGGKPSPRAGT
jgi:hypothetical protein